MERQQNNYIPPDQFRAVAKRFSEKALEKRKESDRVWSEYNRLLRDGKEDTEVRAELAERFSWSDRRVNNLILRRVGTMSEKTRVQAMAQVVGTVYAMCQNVTEIAQNADERLDELENRDPEDWVEVEQTETTGGKFGDTTQTKKVTVGQARRDLEDRKLRAYSQFVDAVSKLTQRNIVNVNIGDDLRSKSIEDIDAEMKLLEKQMIRVGDVE